MAEKKVLQFPEGFLWGASTSAYQIEGGVKNNWSSWEEKNADRLVKESKHYWADWQKTKFPEMFERKNYICGQACNSYNMVDEDIDCLKQINSNAYRFGIEWARIEPEEGKFDQDAIDHYVSFCKRLKENNIKIVLNLWHWTHPLWFEAKGGWESKEVRKYYPRYVAKIVEALGEYVDIWTTLNEPMMIIAHGYINGKFPPSKIMSPSLLKVFYNFVAVHKECYKIIHNKFPNAPVGIAMTTGAFTSGSKYNPIEILMVKVANYFRNDWFLDRIKNYYDYIGVNWYHHDRLVCYPPFKRNLNKKVTDRGWEIYPEGIYIVLKNYQKYQKPIYILENGIADTDDKMRAEFIQDHLQYVHQAILEGVDVRGYFHWSLLDNFEWAEGFWPKFGLFAVDHKTWQRVPRPSVGVYADICKNNRIII
jgi:beta-glucosidase